MTERKQISMRRPDPAMAPFMRQALREMLALLASIEAQGGKGAAEIVMMNALAVAILGNSSDGSDLTRCFAAVDEIRDCVCSMMELNVLDRQDKPNQ